ncbi:MAG: REP-associated tyrosine transposase [Aureliella sp.]
MSDYRRYYVKGGTYFFTLVSYSRKPILTLPKSRALLRDAIASIRQRHPFDLVATVLLPDHWHMIMELPKDDSNFSTRIKLIKEAFSKLWRKNGFEEADVSEAQRHRGEAGIWQPRFWEHCVRDEKELESCVDYIHFNPVKHKLVKNVVNWEWSSFHRYLKAGHYEPGWGNTLPTTIADLPDDWGEPQSFGDQTD